MGGFNPCVIQAFRPFVGAGSDGGVERHQFLDRRHKAELQQRLPKQRKTQPDKLALLAATMLHVRSANLVELASGLPRGSDRGDMGCQWISRFLENDLVSCDAVMRPFAADILERTAEPGEAISLILDQSKLSDRHQVLMLNVR